jgi:hypothetical protein
LRLAQRVLNRRDAVAADDGDKILRAAVDKATEGLADAGDAGVVKPDQRIGKGDEHEEADELAHVEASATVRGGKRLLHAEPYEHDGGKRDADAKAQCVDCGGCGAGQSIASLGDPIQHSHTSPRRSPIDVQ